jgi:prevent-host-death family protein
MRQVSIHEAKTTLSQLVEAAEAGEKVILARAGKPVAQLVRLRPRKYGIKLGLLKGRVPQRLLDEIDRPLSAGLRPVQIWVPDIRRPGFAAECRRQSLLLHGDAGETEALRWIETVTDTDGWA